MNGEHKLWAIIFICGTVITVTFIILASLFPAVWMGP